jgi:hypothetical protein
MIGWLNINNAAEYADVSRDTMRAWLAEGLRHIRKGKMVRTKPGWIDDFLMQFEEKQEFDLSKLKII